MKESAMHDTTEPREPYRLFFPLGLAMAAIGAVPWILFHFGALSVYPTVFHGRVMFHGFLMSFISGFLMTAAPRMSGTEACRPSEASAVLVLLAAQLFAAGNAKLSGTLFSLHAAFLLFFIIRRMSHRKQSPPSSFIFVPAGLATAFLGGLLLTFSDALPAEWGQLGRLLAFQAFVLNLIIGLGSRLIPVLSRAPGALSPMQGGGSRWSHHLPLLILLNLSFVFEVFVEKRTGLGLRALVLTWAAIASLRVFAPMNPLTALGIALRGATVFLFAPYYLMLFFPGAEIHWLHLTYIGGLGMMTLMVAVRVTLAHGGASFEKEVWSRGLAAAALMFVLAALLRALTPVWLPAESFKAFALAAALWIAGLLLWWLTLGRYLEKPLAIFKRWTS
jgi:uncharacterized protein involved in response to NO